MNQRNRENNPYSKFLNKDKDYLPSKINFNKSISKDFFSIVLSGDITKLDQFITNNNFNINSLDNEGINSLHLILNTDLSELDKLSVIKYLINKKIFIENKNKMGETPLHIAAKNNLKSIIIELINNGANIQSPDSLQITPLHYLARGFIIDCEKSYTENIIDDPKPKIDKKVISEIAKDIRDFYNNYLLKKFAKFNLIENRKNPENKNEYPNRLIKFFKHIKNAAIKIIKEDESFLYDSTQIASDIKKIAVDVTLSDEEKKLQNEKIRTDYYNKVFKIIKRNDVRFDKNIDLTTSIHLDTDGLNLANYDEEYSFSPFNKDNYDFKKDTSFYKVNSEQTFNQTINEKIQENEQQLFELQNNIRLDMDNLHNEIGTGVIQTCEYLASFIYTINFYQEIFRLNEFIVNNPINRLQPYKMTTKKSKNAILDLKSNKRSISINKILLSSNYFLKKYLMRYEEIGINGLQNALDIILQDDINNYYAFSREVLKKDTNIVYRNNITSQNIIADNNEIVIDFRNFNWNINDNFNQNQNVETFSLAFHNKTSKMTTYISKDSIWRSGNKSNNILNYSSDMPRWDDTKHIYGDYNLGAQVDININISNQPKLRKLIKLRISKPTKNNTLNLSLDYLSNNNKNITYNFDPGQYKISFIVSKGPIANVNVIPFGAPIVANTNIKSNVVFDLSDFYDNGITYESFFDSHNNNNNQQFIFTPLIALINQIKGVNNYIKNEMDDNINNFTPNLDEINVFYNNLHKWYIRYYETLNIYSTEFIKVYPISNIITNIIDRVNFKNNLQNPLYKNMYQNILNNKMDLYQKIDEEILSVRNLLEKIIYNTNDFINLLFIKFNYYKIYQYFNEKNDNIDLIYDISFNNILKEKIKKLDDSHFSDNDGNLIVNLNNNDVDNAVKNYFSKYNDINSKILDNYKIDNNLVIQEIGIQFIDNIGTTSFTDVEYDPRILNGYFYLTRYRMIEEIVLDIHFESANNGSEQESIYNKVKNYVTNNLGQIDPLMERPLILSIVGDLIDNHLISNVKKALFDAVTEMVNEKIKPIIGTGTQIPLIVQSTNPQTIQGNVEINFSAVDFDVEFGLNLGEQDDLVEKALSKIINLNLDKLLELSFGDMLLSNKIKYKTEIGEKTNEIVQQIFYPSDFLSSINSSRKCVICDNDIINLIENKLLNLNKKDYYGNSALYYAINSQNYLFVNWLINKNYKCIEIKNNDKQSPFIYILNKLKSICEYFGKNNNILNQLNKYYTLSLKEEVNKLDNHGNIFKDLDMLVLLYLFLINSSFFNEMFKKDYNLLNEFKEIYEDDELKIDDGSYVKDFNLIFRNPIHDIFKKNKFDEFDVILNLQDKLNKEKKDKEKEKGILEEKILNYTSIQSLLMPTDVSYSTNIQENKDKINEKIINLQTDIELIGEKMTKIKTDIELKKNDNFKKSDLGFSDIFDEIFEISKSYQDGKLKDFNFSQFLKGLRKVSENPEFINNTYFFHNLISKFIIKFIEYSEKILNKPYLEINKSYLDLDELININNKLDKLVNVMKKTMYKSIFYKNNNIKNIDKNENLNKEFLRICFTIDVVIGNLFYKVLKRLMMTFLKTRYPVSDINSSKFLEFIREKVDRILNKIQIYIQPNISKNNKYEPSELTKKMVLLVGGYKSNKNEYSSLNEEEFFEFIISSIKNNGFELINDNEPLIEYLKKIFLPYFISYYRICITKLTNVTNSYENYILSQYYNLNIFKLLLEKKIEIERDNTPTPTSVTS